MTIGQDDTLDISYRDPTDGSLKVAVGRRVEQTKPPEPTKKTGTEP